MVSPPRQEPVATDCQSDKGEKERPKQYNPEDIHGSSYSNDGWKDRDPTVKLAKKLPDAM
jgi:hypothetical protein